MQNEQIQGIAARSQWGALWFPCDCFFDAYILFLEDLDCTQSSTLFHIVFLKYWFRPQGIIISQSEATMPVDHPRDNRLDSLYQMILKNWNHAIYTHIIS